MHEHVTVVAAAPATPTIVCQCVASAALLVRQQVERYGAHVKVARHPKQGTNHGHTPLSVHHATKQRTNHVTRHTSRVTRHASRQGCLQTASLIYDVLCRHAVMTYALWFVFPW